MHSVSDLTTSSRKTSGTVPPRLVGASTTIVGDKLYLFGGRLVAERRMVSDLYVFDLETFVWTRVPPYTGDDVPGARYFHSADSWQNFLIVFGGMGHKPDATTTDDLVVLNDVRFLDLNTFRWLPPDARPLLGPDGDPIDPSTSASSIFQQGDSSRLTSNFAPRARYAHLSAISGGRLHIIGGQDLQNAWLDDICIYDLRAKRWAARRSYPRHAGTYRSVAVSAQWRVRDPQKEVAENREIDLGQVGARFGQNAGSHGTKEFTSSESLIHLPYSTEATNDHPNDIFLYSNYNFTDVKRELEVFSPRPENAGDLDMTDRSSAMTGTVLPPGLRFPTGVICGHHLIFTGTYLAHSYQSYSIWALDLNTMTWTRLDPGAALSQGSWFRAALWVSPKKSTSKLLIFGNRQGSLVEDYNRRLLAWDDVAVVDLEAFGIYQPPPRALDIRSQELGLAALEEGLLADFEIVTDDGRRIPCSRRLLESRWPWFKEQRRLIREATTRLVSGNQELNAIAQLAPPLPPMNGESEDDILPAPVPIAVGTQPDVRPDPRMTPRALVLSEPYAVALALLQYLYSRALLTPLQHAPAVLSQLLLLSASYSLDEMGRLVRHAMHRALAPATSVGVYEVATLCGCQSLQIRALKAVMASSRRNTNRTRGGSTSNTGPGPPGPGGSSGSGGGSNSRDGPSQGPGPSQGGAPGSSSGLAVSMSRSRGMSDTRGLGFGAYGNSVADASIAGLESGIPEDVSPDTELDGYVDVGAEHGMGMDYDFSVGPEDSDEEVGTLGREDSATPTASVPLSPLAPATFSSQIPSPIEPAPAPSLTYTLSDEDKRKIELRMSSLRRSTNLSVDSLYRALQDADETPLSAGTFGGVSPQTTSASASLHKMSPGTSDEDEEKLIFGDAHRRSTSSPSASLSTSISSESENGPLRPQPNRRRPLPTPPGSFSSTSPSTVPASVSVAHDLGRSPHAHVPTRSASAPSLTHVDVSEEQTPIDISRNKRESHIFGDRPLSFAIPFEVADAPLAEPSSSMPTSPRDSVITTPSRSPKVSSDATSRFVTLNSRLWDLEERIDEEEELLHSPRKNKRSGLRVSVQSASTGISCESDAVPSPNINREPDIELQGRNPAVSPLRRRAYTTLADLALTIPNLTASEASNVSPSSRTAASSVLNSPRESLLITTASMYSPPSPGMSPIEDEVPPLPMSTFNIRSGAILAPHYHADDDMGGLSESSTSSHRSRASTRPSPLTPDSPLLPTPAGNDFANMQTFHTVHGLVVSFGQAQREREREELRSAELQNTPAQRSYAAEARERVRERIAGVQRGMGVDTFSEGEDEDDVTMDMFEEALLARRAREGSLGFSSSYGFSGNEKNGKENRVSLAASPVPPLSPSTHAFGTIHNQKHNSSQGHVAFASSPKDEHKVGRYDRSELREAKARSQQGLAAAGFVVNSSRQRSPKMHSPIQTGLSPTRSKFANAPPSPLSLTFSASTDTSSSQQSIQSPPHHNLNVQINQTKTHIFARQELSPPSPAPFSNFTTIGHIYLDARDKTPTPVTTTITVEKGNAGSLLSKFRKRSNNGSGRSPTPTGSGGNTPVSLTFSNTSSDSNSGSVAQTGFNLTPTPSHFNPAPAGYPDTRPLSPKSAKAEAKRRKKEEEKVRLEALAMQFKQGRVQTKADVVSVSGSQSIMSGSSSERRKLANEWVEESKCMYGGIGASWGGL